MLTERFLPQTTAVFITWHYFVSPLFNVFCLCRSVVPALRNSDLGYNVISILTAELFNDLQSLETL